MRYTNRRLLYFTYFSLRSLRPCPDHPVVEMIENDCQIFLTVLMQNLKNVFRDV